MPQSFLEAGEHGCFVARFDIDDAIGVEAGLCERWRKKVGLGDAPEHLAFGASEDARGEQGCGCAIDDALRAAGDFVQRSTGQTSAGQPRIDCVDPERQHAVVAAIGAFDLCDSGAKSGKLRARPCFRHGGAS